MSLLKKRFGHAWLVAGVLLLGAPGPAYAFTPNVAREWNHFVECLPLMFSDPAAHARLCGPSRHAPSFKSLLEPVPGSVPASKPVVPPKPCPGGDCPPPEPPPPEDEDDECPFDEPCRPGCIPDLPCGPGCLPDFPCPPENRG